jgi:uncharacterized protein
MYNQFEWDQQKAQANLKKHGVSFELAMHVFDDPFAYSRQDRDVNGELRWQTIGRVDGYLLLLVAHTVVLPYEEEELIRIISARRADRTERKRYENEQR